MTYDIFTTSQLLSEAMNALDLIEDDRPAADKPVSSAYTPDTSKVNTPKAPKNTQKTPRKPRAKKATTPATPAAPLPDDASKAQKMSMHDRRAAKAHARGDTKAAEFWTKAKANASKKKDSGSTGPKATRYSSSAPTSNKIKVRPTKSSGEKYKQTTAAKPPRDRNAKNNAEGSKMASNKKADDGRRDPKALDNSIKRMKNFKAAKAAAKASVDKEGDKIGVANARRKGIIKYNNRGGRGILRAASKLGKKYGGAAAQMAKDKAHDVNIGTRMAAKDGGEKIKSIAKRAGELAKKAAPHVKAAAKTGSKHIVDIAKKAGNLVKKGVEKVKADHAASTAAHNDNLAKASKLGGLGAKGSEMSDRRHAAFIKAHPTKDRSHERALASVGPVKKVPGGKKDVDAAKKAIDQNYQADEPKKAVAAKAGELAKKGVEKDKAKEAGKSGIHTHLKNIHTRLKSVMDRVKQSVADHKAKKAAKPSEPAKAAAEPEKKPASAAERMKANIAQHQKLHPEPSVASRLGHGLVKAAQDRAHKVHQGLQNILFPNGSREKRNVDTSAIRQKVKSATSTLASRYGAGKKTG